MAFISTENIWREFNSENEDIKNYKIMNFSGSKDISNSLTDSICTGEKRGSSSLIQMYENNIPEIGDYNIVTNFENSAKCIVITEFVKVLKFNEMTKELAIGESDLYGNLESWKKAHEEFFSMWLGEKNEIFSDEMTIVYHKFKRVY